MCSRSGDKGELFSRRRRKIHVISYSGVCSLCPSYCAVQYSPIRIPWYVDTVPVFSSLPVASTTPFGADKLEIKLFRHPLPPPPTPSPHLARPFTFRLTRLQQHCSYYCSGQLGLLPLWRGFSHLNTTNQIRSSTSGKAYTRKIRIVCRSLQVPNLELPADLV